MAVSAPVTLVELSVSSSTDNEISSISASVTQTSTIISAPVQLGVKGDSGEDGNAPVLSWIGDKIAFDGVASGPSLTGQSGEDGNDGHSPSLSWSGDQIAIDGIVSGPHLTGLKGDSGDAGDQRVFVQSSAPDFNGLSGLWMQTGINGDGMTLWIEDGL